MAVSDRLDAGRLGSQRSWGAGADNNDGYLSTNKIRSQCRQPIVVTLCPQVLDRYVAALDKSCAFQTFVKCSDILAHCLKRCAAQKSDHGHCGLLCAAG